MIDARVFIKAPIAFKNKCNIYPPSVQEILTNPAYPQFRKILTITQEDITDELAKKESKEVPPTPFEFLLINCYHNPAFRELTEKSFEFFIHSKITFFYEQKALVIGDLKEVVQKIDNVNQLVFLQEEDYFDFQNAIRLACGDKPVKPPELPNPNEDPRIARMKAKARERDRIKARKGASNGISIETCLVAICCMGIGLTPLNIGEMSYAAINPLMQMSQEKEKYDIDIRSLLAGADSKKIKPKYWIRNSD